MASIVPTQVSTLQRLPITGTTQLSHIIASQPTRLRSEVFLGYKRASEPWQCLFVSRPDRNPLNLMNHDLQNSPLNPPQLIPLNTESWGGALGFLTRIPEDDLSNGCSALWMDWVMSLNEAYVGNLTLNGTVLGGGVVSGDWAWWCKATYTQDPKMIGLDSQLDWIENFLV